MIFVLPFCTKDYDRALEVLGWIEELHGRITNHRCLLIGSCGMPQDKLEAIATVARRAFKEVICITPPVEDERGWPFSCNTLFRCAASFIQEQLKEPWFWNEPDAIPLQPGFLDRLEAEYVGCRRPFMGTVFPHPWPHITGTAVYPPNVQSHSPKMFAASTKPWDLIDAKAVLKLSFQTPLIQHEWGDVENNIAPTFPDGEAMKHLKRGAVVFHRNKDGTLIKRLRERFPKKSVPEGTKYSNCIVQLGRYGDIINVLPIAKHINDNYQKPFFMVSEDFADILDGVNYVEPVIYGGEYSLVEPAIDLANALYEHVIVSQVWGKTYRVPHECQGYNIESWRMAGYLDRWADESLKLVFDRRDKERELKLIRKNIAKNKKPIMLINLSGGHSGPFEKWQVFQFDIQHRWGSKFQIVDLSSIIAKRVYDLLGMYEMGDVLLTSDTATLHLAAATDIPTIAFTNDKDPTGWLNTVPRKPCLLTIPYGHAMKRMEEVHTIIKDL